MKAGQTPAFIFFCYLCALNFTYMQEIRNIAIIAHVDHGKTTLVDRMIYQANLVRQPENLGQLILDNNDHGILGGYNLP